MLHFPLCRQSVLGMPRIEIDFEFHMVFCFGIRLTPNAVSSTRIYLQQIARPVESDRSINGPPADKRDLTAKSENLPLMHIFKLLSI